MVHASGYSQIGLARKNPDEKPLEWKPEQPEAEQGRYFCARCVGWLRLAVRLALLASLGALLGALT
jgi:hypothetical protein